MKNNNIKKRVIIENINDISDDIETVILITEDGNIINEKEDITNMCCCLNVWERFMKLLDL